MGERLTDRIAVVTGSDSGIGQAIAIEFAREGADVVVTWHSDDRGAQHTREEVERAGRKALVQRLDIRDPASVEALFGAAQDGLGTPYILVNDAGVGGPGTEVVDTTDEQWDDTLKTDLYGPFYCCRQFVRMRKAQGGKGKIINITSVHEEIVLERGAAYDAAKGGLRMLTRTLALELAPLRINVNSIAPGMIATPMTRKATEDPKRLAEASARIPWNRPGEPWEVGKLAAYLASEDADYVTGQTFFIDGGLTLNVGQGA
ncbi:MAG: SDR family NAD(P)-dependent oxidoreductase [Rhodospirillaceae bacterium]